MAIVTNVEQKNKRYLPHELTTKINSVKLYRQTKDIDFVVRRYHISKASLMRWNRLYDGTKNLSCPSRIGRIGNIPKRTVIRSCHGFGTTTAATQTSAFVSCMAS